MMLADLPTPCLVLDRTILARNIRAMALALKRLEVPLRPHMKTAKSIDVARMALDGQPVSSTRIREMIRTGNFDAASQMLGRQYAICGRIVKGDRIGQTIGFPTANLEASQLVLPPNGVYAASTKVEERFYRAALNIGVRPTVATAQPQLRVEAHLLDFTGDLYGRELELQILSKLREERRFESVEELRRQIAHDVASVRALD